MPLYQKINNQIKKWNFIDQKYADTRYPGMLGEGKYFYLGGNNKSDSNDGETPDKPFADINYAIKYISNKFVGKHAVLILQEDVENFDGHITACPPAGGAINITSDNTKRTIRIPTLRSIRVPSVSSGIIILTNINITNENSWVIHTGDYSSHTSIYLDNITITANNTRDYGIIYGVSPCSTVIFRKVSFVDCTGMCSIRAAYGQTVVFPYDSEIVYDNCSFTDCNIASVYGGLVIRNGSLSKISGTATGKRYVCTNSGRIIVCGAGPDFIPGSEDGICDETSVYI